MFFHRNPVLPSAPSLLRFGILPPAPTGEQESKIIPTTTEIKRDPELARLKLERTGLMIGLGTLILTALGFLREFRRGK